MYTIRSVLIDRHLSYIEAKKLMYEKDLADIFPQNKIAEYFDDTEPLSSAPAALAGPVDDFTGTPIPITATSHREENRGKVEEGAVGVPGEIPPPVKGSTESRPTV
jgi:hypothetical protein